MSGIGDNGGKKEWEALVKVYEYLKNTYPDFQKQVDEFGFSTLECNDKGELILELDNLDSDIVVDSDKVVKLLKKAGLKRFSKIESLTLDRVLEYDYDMAKGLLNILVRRGKGSISLNIHFYYLEEKGIPNIENFLKKNGSSEWSSEIPLGDFAELFLRLLIKPLYKEGLFWIHMIDDTLHMSILSNGEITESIKYGEGTDLDKKLEDFLAILSEMFEYPVKEIFLLSEGLSKVRYRKNSDGEISLSVY